MRRGNTRLVILGDSVTVGTGFSGVTAEERYVAHLQRSFAAGATDVEVIDSALEGIDTAYAIRRFARMVTTLEPDAVLVQLGLNDVQPPGNRPPVSTVEYRRNLIGLVDRILTIEARPLLATPNPRFALPFGSRPGAEWAEPYVAEVRSVAEHFQLPLVDNYARFLASPVSLPELIPDGIHPSAVGQALIAENMAEVLVPVFGGTWVSADHLERI